ncbi:MAG: leucine-rich repeat domain-containing protein [Prevotella sp.]|nr:leucine-rich repeat domain-containing protein [Prevotella sp.]
MEILKKNSKKDGKFENLVLNLALQKIDSDSFEYDGDAVYTNDKKRLVYCMSQETSFTIPEGVEIIGEMAFRGKKALKNVIIANSVKEIEHDAFYDCDELDNIYVPAGVKVVRSYAFAECDKLKKVTFAGTPEKVGRHTFDDCDQLHDIIVPVGSSKFFRKELHFIEGDTDYLVLEDPKKKAEKKADKKEAAEKKVETPEKKAAKKAKKEPAKTK